MAKNVSKELKVILIGVFISLFIALFVFRNYIFSPGFAFYGDFGINIGMKNYGSYLWNSINQQPIIPNHLLVNYWMYLLPLEIGQRVSVILEFTLIGSCMFFAVYKLLLQNGFSRLESFLGAVYALVFSMINPLTPYRVVHGKMFYFCAMLPILFYLLQTTLNNLGKSSRKHLLKLSIFTSLVLFVMSISVRLPYLLPLIIAVLIVNIRKIMANFKAFVGYAIFTSVIFVALGSLWILPLFIPTGTIPSPQHYVVTDAVLRLLSRHAQLFNVFIFNSHWHNDARQLVQFSDPSMETLRIFCLTMIPILAFLPLLVLRKNKTVSTLALTALITIFLAKGTNPPFPEFYEWFVFKSPFSYFGWQFRGSGKWSFLVLMPVFVLLTSFSIAIIIRKIRSLNIKNKNIISGLSLLLLLLIPLISGHPLLSGDVKGRMSPEPIPLEYVQANDWLKNNSKGKVLWYPSIPRWGSSVPSIDYGSSYWRYVVKRSFEMRKQNLLKVISPLGIEYIVIRGDLNNYSTLLAYLRNLEGITFVKNFGKLQIFKLKNAANNVYVGKEIIIVPDYKDFEAISCIHSYDREYVVLFPSVSKLDQKILDITSLFINPDFLFFKISAISDNAILLEPFKETFKYNPSKLWSKASTSDPLHGGWHPYLKKFGIENWQFDYGYGLVFTWANLVLPESINLKDQDIIRSWTFEKERDLNEWRNNTPRVQFRALQELLLENGALNVVLWNSTWGWKLICSPRIRVSYPSAYRFVLRVRGEHAYKVHVKVAEFDANGKWLAGVYLGGVGSGSFGWKTVSFDYITQSENVSYIQLQIWHGHETPEPLPNVIWIDYVKIYNLTKYARPVTLEMPFNIRETGYYRLFIRYFKNQRGGAIKVYLDSYPMEIITKDQLNKFIWSDLGVFYLKKGKHKIVLENVRGFNAVNLFLLVPDDAYYTALENVRRLLQNKTVIYIFEGESDIYRKNAEILSLINASNGRVLLIKSGGKVWQSFDTIKDSYYRIAIRLRGNAKVIIDNKSYIISSDDWKFVYLDPIYLNTNSHALSISPLNINVASWSFQNSSDVDAWREYTPERQFGALQEILWDPVEKALKAVLYNSTWGWKVIQSPLIPVSCGKTYVLRFSIKAVNGHVVHFKIFEYDENGKLLNGIHAGRIGDSTFDWKTIKYRYAPKNSSVAYIQLQIWHGHLTDKPLPNIIWIKNVTMYEEKPLYLDVIWIYSVSLPNSTMTLNDLFEIKEAPAEVTSYERINPTLWKARVFAKKPFMLVFAEAYDPLWEARVYRDGKLTAQVRSIPVYSIINGFWINATGDLEIVIRYTPQDWFELGLKISSVSFFGCIFYLFYDWRLTRGDAWAVYIHRRLKRFLRRLKKKLPRSE